jgi:ribosomal protein S8E
VVACLSTRRSELSRRADRLPIRSWSPARNVSASFASAEETSSSELCDCQKVPTLPHSLGNFSWGSENVTRKSKIIDTVYHASNNELVRTKTLTRGSIVTIDATPFKTWYQKKYNVDLGGRKAKKVTSHF